jgi:S-adenosylmethionine:tRNA ribosyltransferase-isomerase
MLRRDFFFHLPQELIAQHPLEKRSASRLLVLDGISGSLKDRVFTELPELLEPNDLLVFNDTRVIPARLYGRKLSGGHVEVLIERLLDDQKVFAHVRASKAPKPASQMILADQVMVTVMGRQEELFELRFESDQPLVEILERYGQVPLPPYIVRAADDTDQERYQTVYGQRPGAVAAPTAGLHFDAPLLDRLASIEKAFVTLHVGAGTFQPMRTEHIEDHVIHSEIIEVSEEVCAQVRATQARGGRVIAVGTTTLRSLETACQTGHIQPFHGETQLYIYPGYQFRCVDVLVTNFHLPESTLLMLVSAFAGHDHVMHAYHHAIAQRYRFFSYGDAMFITRSRQA